MADKPFQQQCLWNCWFRTAFQWTLFYALGCCCHLCAKKSLDAVFSLSTLSAKGWILIGLQSRKLVPRPFYSRGLGSVVRMADPDYSSKSFLWAMVRLHLDWQRTCQGTKSHVRWLTGSTSSRWVLTIRTPTRPSPQVPHLSKWTSMCSTRAALCSWANSQILRTFELTTVLKTAAWALGCQPQ